MEEKCQGSGRRKKRKTNAKKQEKQSTKMNKTHEKHIGEKHGKHEKKNNRKSVGVLYYGGFIIFFPGMGTLYYGGFTNSMWTLLLLVCGLAHWPRSHWWLLQRFFFSWYGFPPTFLVIHHPQIGYCYYHQQETISSEMQHFNFPEHSLCFNVFIWCMILYSVQWISMVCLIIWFLGCFI